MVVRNFRNWLRTLGAPEDPIATDTSSEWSAMSLLKAIYQASANGTIGAAITGRAEGLVALSQGAISVTAHYMRIARTSKIAAAASAVSTAADAITTAANASIASAQAGISTNASNLVAGNAMLGQRATKDRRAAAASAAAAAASAASVPTAEQVVLPIQVYS